MALLTKTAATPQAEKAAAAFLEVAIWRVEAAVLRSLRSGVPGAVMDTPSTRWEVDARGRPATRRVGCCGRAAPVNGSGWSEFDPPEQIRLVFSRWLRKVERIVLSTSHEAAHAINRPPRPTARARSALHGTGGRRSAAGRRADRGDAGLPDRDGGGVLQPVSRDPLPQPRRARDRAVAGRASAPQRGPGDLPQAGVRRGHGLRPARDQTDRGRGAVVGGGLARLAGHRPAQVRAGGRLHRC